MRAGEVNVSALSTTTNQPVHESIGLGVVSIPDKDFSVCGNVVHRLSLIDGDELRWMAVSEPFSAVLHEALMFLFDIQEDARIRIVRED